jgi:hypothetical protein
VRQWFGQEDATDHTSFAEATLSLDVPFEPTRKADNYIDDLIVIILGDPNNMSRR